MFAEFYREVDIIELFRLPFVDKEYISNGTLSTLNHTFVVHLTTRTKSKAEVVFRGSKGNVLWLYTLALIFC